MTNGKAVMYGEEYLKDLTNAVCHIEDKHIEFVEMAITALKKQINGGWIKCSERLPDTTDWYWVTCKSGPHVIPPTYARQMLWDVDFKTWQSGYVNANKYSNVIAWQPLPTVLSESEVQ